MLFNDVTILDETFSVKEHMYVGIQDDRIEYVDSKPPKKDYGKCYDGNGRLLMPGFYNAHAHSPMALMRGYGENLALQDWLFNRIFPFEAKLYEDAVYWGTVLCMAESLRFGIVSSSDMYYFIPAMVRAISDSSAKANLSRAIQNMDGRAFEKLESVREMKQAIRNYHDTENGRILIDCSLHAEYTSDEATTRALAEFTKKAGLHMHVHVSETKTEHEECKMRHNGKTPVEYLNECGLFDVPTIAAHCVHIENEDFDILKEKDVTVATNPCSNLKLASGMCDTPKILKHGINLAIGTDSVASNNSLDFLQDVKVMALTGKVKAQDPTAITPREAIMAATINGAKAQGRTDCGAISIGNRADLILLNTDVPHMHPIHNLMNNLVYSASGSDVVMTMVDGRILYENGNFTTIDIEQTIYQTEKVTDDILKRL